MPDELKRAFDQLRRSSEERDVVRAILGKPDGSGNTIVKVSTRPGWCYVRLGSNGELGVTIAQNTNTPYEANRPVKLRWSEKGYYVVQGTNEDAMEYFATGSAYYGDIANHSHQIGTGLEYEIEALRMGPGRVIYNSGWSVYVKPFRYHFGGAWHTYMGGFISLDSYRTTIAGKWSWVLIGVNPMTNTAIAAAGDDYDTTTTLTIDLIDDISFSNYIPCTAVKIKASDSDASDITRYQDAHSWFGAGAGGGDTLLETVTLTETADVEFSNLDDYAGIYSKFRVEYLAQSDVTGQDSDLLVVVFNIGAWLSSLYRTNYVLTNADAHTTANGFGTGVIATGDSNAADFTCGEFTVYNPHDTSHWKHVTWKSTGSNDSGAQPAYGSTIWMQTTAIDTITVSVYDGDGLASGSVLRLYGIL